MDPAVLLQIRREIDAVRDSAVAVRIAVVTSTTPLEVDVAGSGVPVPAKRVAGDALSVDDIVLVLAWRGGLIVIGAIE